MDAGIFLLIIEALGFKPMYREQRRGMRVWSSLVMTPASHAGNPEFESRHAYAFFSFLYFLHFSLGRFSKGLGLRHFARVVKGLAC